MFLISIHINIINRIGGVMVSMFASSAVDRGVGLEQSGPHHHLIDN